MESPFQSLSTAQPATVQTADGASLATSYGDFAAEAAAVEQGAGLMDWSASGVIGVRGPDAAVFLNGVATNNVKALATGRGQENLLCATKGRILHAVLVVHTKPDEFLVLTEPGETEAVARHLETYHVREDLVMGVTSLARLDVLGARAPQLLERRGIAPPAPGHCAANPRDGAPLLMLHMPLGALPRFVLLAPPATALSLARALLEDPSARLVGLSAWDEARIWARVPRFGPDFGPDHLPGEASVYTHMAFDKGCYVGQEIHARMHYRGHPNRKLVALSILESAAAALQVGAALYREGQVAGQITSLARLSRNGTRAAIAMVRYPLAEARLPLATAADGPETIVVSPLASDLGIGK
jgi:folate-binding protein YgfZ